MVKIDEHINKINEIKKHIKNSKGKQKRQYIKCLNRLLKQSAECYLNLNPNEKEKIEYIKIMK